ncbi:MAG: hypothetical protein CSA11_06495 [Chloroflexi bacterium]|nr:MAG: hypothetical protein CSB13_10195 [Chloroflexota bacterium]PIE80872.1 MAG: hypothetical protein CSA11_06495 [Chloroflexota bacterium]
MRRFQVTVRCLLFTVYCVLFVFLVACRGGDAAPEESDVIFQDEFIPGEVGDWLVEGDGIGQTAVVDQQLVISINQPNTMQYVTLQEPAVDNFSLAVDARQITGNPESSYGVLARIRGADQFYRFEITSNGLYMVERHNADGSWSQYLEDWAATSAINQGLNTVNRLKVEARGANLSFSVNGNVVHEIVDTGVGSNTNVGLDAGTFGQAGLQVAFDNVIIRDLSGADTE